MIKKALSVFLVLFLAFAQANANPIDDQAPQLVCSSAPESSITSNDQYIIRQNYAVHYRYDTKTPEYVVEHVTMESISGPAKRKNDFRPDPTVPEKASSQLVDYSSASGTYDRGHMAPAGDNTQNSKVMSETFYLSNMVPLVSNNNRGIWRASEELVRKLVKDGKDIYVISGTIYQPGFKKIGKDSVGVPTHLWKIIYDKKSSKCISFLIPNKSIPTSDLKNRVATIQTISELTKIKFKIYLLGNIKIAYK